MAILLFGFPAALFLSSLLLSPRAIATRQATTTTTKLKLF
jgi:hypothetical protein